jgi:hypothetical protein
VCAQCTSSISSAGVGADADAWGTKGVTWESRPRPPPPQQQGVGGIDKHGTLPCMSFVGIVRTTVRWST